MQTYLDNLLASMLEENKRLATCVTTLKSLVDEAKIDCQINNTENSDNMKHSTEQKPEAIRLAEKLRDAIGLIECGNDMSLAAMELESLHTRVQELEAKEAKPTTGELVMDVRCEGCGYMTHHREHMGCVRAAKQHTHPAPSVPADVVRDAIAAVREQYRGTDWGKAAECICDAIDAAIAAAKENK